MLTAEIGGTAEWYLLALRDGGYDFSAYHVALTQYLAEYTVSSASTRLKFALALQATGAETEYIAQTLEDAPGKQGIMSWVFALHLLQNGAESNICTTKSVTETLLSLQLADGGWALTGTNADVDVTAMVVQALAAQYGPNDTVTAALDSAVELLASRQRETGGFASYGVENAESAAQVIIALSAIGIDCTTDARFFKNGKTPLDAMCDFLLADGSFAHTLGGETNAMATAQAYCALTAYLRMASGESAFYTFTKPTEPIAPPAQTTTVPTTTLPQTEPPQTSVVTTAPATTTVATTTAPTQKTDGGDYRIGISIGIFAVGLLICATLFLCKKRHPKNYAVVLVLAILALCAVWLLKFQTADEYYGHAVTKENPIGTVTVTIRCDTIVGQQESAYIPDDGVILAPTPCEFAEGDSVFSLLTELCRAYSIQLDYSGTGSLVYVRGIHYLYEFDFGDLSGWVYRVNGVAPSVGCGDYEPTDGDMIEFLYTRSLGDDLP